MSEILQWLGRDRYTVSLSDLFIVAFAGFVAFGMAARRVMR